jgi:SAM-dependent methyltransferase
MNIALIENVINDLKIIEDSRIRNQLIIKNLIDFIKLKFVFHLKSKKDLKKIMNKIATTSIHHTQVKYKEFEDEHLKAKYLNVKNYLPKNLKRAYKLKLHNSPPINILDIGSGPGYFCYICNYFGHHSTALDSDDNPIFDDLIKALRITRKIETIEALKKLPNFHKKFDLITGFYVPFNCPKSAGEIWGIEKWKYFLTDIANNLLSENGRALFYLQPGNTGKHYNSELLNYFLNLDANIFGEELYFRSFYKLR